MAGGGCCGGPGRCCWGGGGRWCWAPRGCWVMALARSSWKAGGHFPWVDGLCIANDFPGSFCGVWGDTHRPQAVEVVMAPDLVKESFGTDDELPQDAWPVFKAPEVGVLSEGAPDSVHGLHMGGLRELC